MAGEKFKVIAGMGGPLEYQAGDPRWSEPKKLFYADIPLRGPSIQALGAEDVQGSLQNPATLDQITTYYHPQNNQRLLYNNPDASEIPTYWVVDALYRMPEKEGELDTKDLHPLPLELPLTKEEFEVLALWLGIKSDSALVINSNHLDTDLVDGEDALYKTPYNWSEEDSINELLASLKNFQSVKRGENPNPKNLPVSFDDARLARLISLVEERYQILHLSGSKLSWGEEFWHRSLNSASAFVGLGALGGGIYSLYKLHHMILAHGGYGVQMGTRLASAARFVTWAGVPLEQGGARVVRQAWRLCLTATAVLLAAKAGEKISEKITGADENAEYLFDKKVRNDMMDETMSYWMDDHTVSRAASWFFSSAFKGVAHLFKDTREEMHDLSWNRRQGIVHEGQVIAQKIEDELFELLDSSMDSQQQISWKDLEQKLKAWFKTNKDQAKRVYASLEYAGHRHELKGMVNFSKLITADGTLRSRDALKAHLLHLFDQRKETIKDQLNQRAIKFGLAKVENDALIYQKGDAETEAVFMSQAGHELAEKNAALDRLRLLLLGGGIPVENLVSDAVKKSIPSTDDTHVPSGTIIDRLLASVTSTATLPRAI